MLTFFRKIRKSLLETGSARRYMLYAVGEVLLVMVGILLALQVNNWNEERKNRIEERKILKGLKSEFELNEHQFNNILSVHNRTLAATNKMLQIIEGDREILNNIEMDTLEILSQESWTFDPVRGVSNSLISSGKIDLIRNDSLQLLVVLWNDLVNDYKEDEFELRKLSVEVQLPYLLNKIPISTLTLSSLDKYSGPSNKDYSPLMNSLEYQNILRLRIHWFDEILREGANVQNALNKIKSLLNEEINKK